AGAILTRLPIDVATFWPRSLAGGATLFREGWPPCRPIFLLVLTGISRAPTRNPHRGTDAAAAGSGLAAKSFSPGSASQAACGGWTFHKFKSKNRNGFNRRLRRLHGYNRLRL